MRSHIISQRRLTLGGAHTIAVDTRVDYTTTTHPTGLPTPPLPGERNEIACGRLRTLKPLASVRGGSPFMTTQDFSAVAFTSCEGGVGSEGYAGNAEEL
jgi:hypothetical protein